MNRKTLHQIYAGHVGKVNHKWSIYMDEYDHLFSICLDKLVRFIEIGIQNGGLLEICMKYLGNASVLIRHGFNPDFVCSAYGDSRVSVFGSEVNTGQPRERVFQRCSQFNIYLSSDITNSLELNFLCGTEMYAVAIGPYLVTK